MPDTGKVSRTVSCALATVSQGSGPEEPPTLRLSLGNRVHMEWPSGKWQWHGDTRSSPDAGPRLKPQCQPCSGNAYQHGTWQCQHSQDCPTVGETSSSSHGKSYCGSLSQPLPLVFLRDRVLCVLCCENPCGAHRCQTASDALELRAACLSVLCER